MSYKRTRFAVSKVVLGGGYWVELRPVSKGEAEAFQTAGDEQARSEAGEAMLVQMITRWNLDADDGTILDINGEAVRDLSLADYRTLTEAVPKIINPLADAETAKK